MFDKILVYENSLAERLPALDRAVALAEGTDIEVKIIDVVATAENIQHDHHRKMRSVVELEREDRLEAICEPLRKLKINYTTELLRGRPFAEVVREVVHEGFDLVIKTASLATPNEVTGVMGPTDMRIVRNCPCPVWLEVEKKKSSSPSVLVAVDPQTVINDLNISLVKRGVKLARMMKATLHVVAAWEAMDESFLSDKMESKKLTDYLTFLESCAKESLDHILAPAGTSIHSNHVHFHKGIPSEVILNCTESLRPDVVVMGTVCEVGIGGLLIGNTADMVLRQIERPVLAIKPEAIFTT
ncbi:Nucleotide-binding universal stress protein, UspA family [Neorhodopirellula lusitana]|uniref:Nucleotide-binding universal stress protein, UspA family n=1 Tax=Neorhodopirellula lusitana TaxID=445327 RepID=A0ABY1QJY4_9BACT|nr:universal stress protein [Neorhodopirellula lusitana]SMP73828.1 Nucleotide-binding universal stress protein, UspA family [Neorhodopirellula lusitana]